MPQTADQHPSGADLAAFALGKLDHSAFDWVGREIAAGGLLLLLGPRTARPAGPAERVWKWAARRPAVAASVAAAVLFLALGVAGVAWQWRVAVGERNRAVRA